MGLSETRVNCRLTKHRQLAVFLVKLMALAKGDRGTPALPFIRRIIIK